MAFFFQKGFSRALLLVLLSLSSCLIFVPRSSAASVYDSWYSPPASLVVDLGSCPTVDVTATWYDILQASTNLSAPAHTALDQAFNSGTVTISQHVESGFMTVHIVWSATPATLGWSESGGITVGSSTTHSAMVRQLSTSGCVLGVDNYISPASGPHQVIEKPAAPEEQLYKIYGQGTNMQYPSGYAGATILVVPNFDPNYIPSDYETLISETMDIVVDNMDTAVYVGLFLGSANFILQWFVYTVMSQRWGRAKK